MQLKARLIDHFQDYVESALLALYIVSYEYPLISLLVLRFQAFEEKQRDPFRWIHTVYTAISDAMLISDQERLGMAISQLIDQGKRIDTNEGSFCRRLIFYVEFSKGDIYRMFAQPNESYRIRFDKARTTVEGSPCCYAIATSCDEVR